MPQQIRVWMVTSEGKPVEMNNKEKVGSETQLEDWLESDISILDPDLLVVGRQVRTDFGGEIDLLCLDRAGDIVVVELKKDRTPRDVTAQALDYASWAKDLEYEDIQKIWESYLEKYLRKEISLNEAFDDKFDDPLPDALNANHRSLIVANSIDDSTERIVRYLSDLSIPINVATVQYFKDEEGREILAQVFLIEPEMAQEKAKPKSKRTKYLLAKDMQEMATKRGVGSIYEKLCDDLSGIMSHGSYGDTARYFRINTEEGWRMMFVAEIGTSDKEKGLEVRMNAIRLANHFGIDYEKLDEILPEEKETMSSSEWRKATEDEKKNWIGYRCYFQDVDEVEKFVTGLQKLDQVDSISPSQKLAS